MEWIEFNNTVRSFKKGTILKDDTGKTYLVGDINTELGQCKCCNITEEAKITHYSFDLTGSFERISNSPNNLKPLFASAIYKGLYSKDEDLVIGNTYEINLWFMPTTGGTQMSTSGGTGYIYDNTIQLLMDWDCIVLK